ncbi:MAG: FAD-dependent oxidoreductase [Patescibacteria group bacterium]
MIYDLIIIGAGPAGVTAGIYGARQRLKTLVITKGFGGQLNKKAVNIENYPGLSNTSGMDLVEMFKKHLEETETTIEVVGVTKIEKKDNLFLITTGDEKEFVSHSVIIASGADPRPLEVEGEKEFIGKGVSYCALCDGAMFKDKEVIVVGGGNSAFETAIFLSKIVKKIYVLEYGEKIGAFKDNQEILEKLGKAEILTMSVLKKINGDKFVNSVVYEDRKTGEEKKLDISGIFVEIGYQPATSFVKELVNFSERDEIAVNPITFETKTPGLFAAGDVNDGRYKQVVIACAEGAIAALSAFEYLSKI